MTRTVLPALAGLALLALGVRSVQQDARIDALQDELSAIRAHADEAALAHATRPAPAATSAAAPARPAAPAAAPLPPPAPRVSVGADEVARVESAVLSLLEADRPELREKLRAVVQEHQESTERARQEQRRERWAARTELRLAELSGSDALTPAERQTIVSLLLGTRDQISEIRRSAETPEAIAGVRETSRRLRDETKEQIRKLLGSARYPAYDRVMNRDDEEEEERGPPRPGR